MTHTQTALQSRDCLGAHSPHCAAGRSAHRAGAQSDALQDARETTMRRSPVRCPPQRAGVQRFFNYWNDDDVITVGMRAISAAELATEFNTKDDHKKFYELESTRLREDSDIWPGQRPQCESSGLVENEACTCAGAADFPTRPMEVHTCTERRLERVTQSC